MNLMFVIKVIVSLLVCYSGNTHGLSQNEKCTKLLTAFPPDPESSCCGMDASGQLLGGNETFIDQYPWLVLLEYSKDSGPIKTLCGGALISGRYVLTAGHCVTGSIQKFGGPPKTARLGEFDTSSDGLDCVVVDGGGSDCNEGTVTIPIEEIIVHPQYEKGNNSKLKFNHNIALIRLKELAPFTDFIRPICLPSNDVTITTNPAEYLRLTEAGWGTKPPNPIKLHQTLNYVNKTTCQEGYKMNQITLDDTQFCAGAGTERKCRGSSGGPLMLEGSKYEVVGVDSFGPVPCGSRGLPTVYTNVFLYKDWIQSVIKE